MIILKFVPVTAHWEKSGAPGGDLKLAGIFLSWHGQLRVGGEDDETRRRHYARTACKVIVE